MHTVFTERSVRRWEFHIKAASDKRLWFSMAIRFTWVTVLLWSYQYCHCHSCHRNRPRHSAENPRRKMCFMGIEVNLFIQEKDGNVPNPGPSTGFLFRQGLFSGRSQAEFVKRISPRSGAHTQLECLEANKIPSRRLLLTWYPWGQGLGKSRWGSTSPPQGGARCWVPGSGASLLGRP